MGCMESKTNTEEAKTNAEIDTMIEREKSIQNNEVKLLLLGSGESGKSTVAKQMKIIYMNGFTDEELCGFKPSIYGNLVVCMRALIEAASEFEYEIENKTAAENLTRPENEYVTDEFPPELATDIKTLWSESVIKQTYERRDEFQIFDCAAYLFDNIDRIAAADYKPSLDDVIITRVRTTGVNETEFKVNDTTFRLVDVGGQRNERRKWIHCFEDVTAVIFVIALSEYNQTLYEDDSTNRMDESLRLFKEICNNKFFVNTPMIVFLNKSDLFREKLKKFPLSDKYTDYKGGEDFDKAVQFITTMFEAQSTVPGKALYFHTTCATDTKSVETVFNVVKDTILKTLAKSESI